MKSYKSLTFRYLKKQIKRTGLSIFGVILSIALITAIGTMMESLRHETIENHKKNSGDFHTSISQVDNEELKILESHVNIGKLGFESLGGFAQPAENAIIKVIGSNDNYNEMMHLSLIEGKMPEEKNEIAVEKWMLYELPGEPQIGDILILNIMNKSEEEISEGAAGSEYIQRSFIVCGILPNSFGSQMRSISRGVVTLEAIEDIKGTANLKYDAYIQIKKGLAIQKSIQSVGSDLKIPRERIRDNSRLLAMLGESRDKTVNNVYNYIILFLVVLIIIATAAVIYNAFHISVIERIRQFGILRSVGTTPKQIREIVIGEIGIIIVIALPLGLLSGILAVKIVLALLNMSSYSVFAGTKVVISARVLLGSAVVGVISVFLSALSPAFIAGRVSPIQAIMSQSKDKKKIKQPKGNRLVRRLLGIEGEMAYKNLGRNRKRFFVTVFSMCVGISIFIVFNSFAQIMFEGLHGRDGNIGDYKIDSYSLDGKIGYTLEDFNTIRSMQGVKNVYKNAYQNSTVTFPISKLTQDYKREMEYAVTNVETLQDGISFKPIYISKLWSYDEELFKMAKSDLSDGTLDIKAINEENGVVIVQNVELRRGADSKTSTIKAVTLRVGDYIYIDTTAEPFDGKQDLEGLNKLKIVGVLERLPINHPYPEGGIAVITTEEIYQRLTGKKSYEGFDIEVEEGADKHLIKKSLTDIVQRSRGGMLIDFGDIAARQHQAKVAVSVLLYGFVAVIALIGVLNIINTISTNLILRTREFGTLKAVGMTMLQMRKMIIIEGVMYGVIGSIWGTIIGTALSKVFYNIVVNIGGMVWYLPVNAIVIATTGTLIITMLATLIPLKRVSKMNIIEAIGREE